MKKLNSETARWIKANYLLLGAAIFAMLIVAGTFYSASKETVAVDATNTLALQPETNFSVASPLPLTVDLDKRVITLGEKLFHEVRLSGNDTISCASCHGLNTGGVDNRFRSIGVNGGVGGVNAPTVFNSSFNFVQFWDGRASTLEEQIEGPVNHPLEMASNWSRIIGKLQGDKSYAKEFAALYPDGITRANIKTAIATFERSLVTPSSRFDKFLRGDRSALNEQEQKGFDLFQDYGCSSCHQGINLGGNMFEKMGLMGDYFTDRGNVTEVDNGRFNVNHLQHSLHEFRVPGLRNVALTAPYFHDGNAQTLEQAVTIMAKYQLGRSMPQHDLEAIVAFLRSLTGEYQGKPL